jgi:hypothetical protein
MRSLQDGFCTIAISSLQLHLDLSRSHGGLQRCVILFSLIGVGEREFAHRLVEIVLFADIAGDCPGITRLRMRAGQNPAADFGIDRQDFGIEGFDQGAQRHVAQLALVVAITSIAAHRGLMPGRQGATLAMRRQQ